MSMQTEISTDIIEEALRYFRRGYNGYEVAVKLSVPREELLKVLEADREIRARYLEARKAGADALVSTYKDMLLEAISRASGSEKVSLMRELGAHIRWEAAAVHAGTYTPKPTAEETTKNPTAKLTKTQLEKMATEYLMKGGGGSLP